jgi:hydroxyacylglutathione hydrolase
MNSVEIEVVPMLSDNYGYLIWRGSSAVLVDAGEAAPVRARIDARKGHLTHILITHDHHDHIDGIAELKKRYDARVIGPAGSGVPLVDEYVSGGEVLDIAGLRVEVIWTPGHRPAHAAFYLPESQAVFSGDAMFGAGCGRLFGNPPEMLYSSIQKLAKLPDATRVYFGHEYTASNLRFAQSLEPYNTLIRERLASLMTPSSPSTIALEKATNPFVRARNADEFAERRKAKDSF